MDIGCGNAARACRLVALKMGEVAFMFLSIHFLFAPAPRIPSGIERMVVGDDLGIGTGSGFGKGMGLRNVRIRMSTCVCVGAHANLGMSVRLRHGQRHGQWEGKFGAKQGQSGSSGIHGDD